MTTGRYLIKYSGPLSDFACDDDGRPLYWSLTDGWVDRDSASTFTADEHDSGIPLPVEMFEDGIRTIGEWVDLLGDWEDRLFAALPNPDEIGMNEYQAVYEVVQSAIEASNLAESVETKTFTLSCLDELDGWLKCVRQIVEETT